MAEIKVNEIVGDTFEHMTLAEMSLVQGTGDIDVLKSSTPISKATGCWSIISAGVGASVGIVISLARC